MDFIWKSIVLVISGMFLLRLAGRKSIAQMTIATTIVMISIGSLIVQPIANKSVFKAIGAAFIFILVLILIEILQLKFKPLEYLMVGRSVIVIEGGKPIMKNLKKLRLTVDKLEIYLRQQGVANISDVKTATLEPNGQLGYELMPDARPLTIGEFKRLMGALIPHLQNNSNFDEFTLFDEVKIKEKEIEREQNLQ